MHLSEIAIKLHAFVHNYSSVKPQEAGLVIAILGTPLLADPLGRMSSRRKHPFEPLHRLHNRLRRVCEICTETAKNGRNREPHNSLRLKMISLARMRDAKVSTRSHVIRSNLAPLKSYFTLNAKLPMPKYYMWTLGPKPQGLAPWDPHR